ncbi:MAG: FAD-dependent thymidylate synthase [Bacillota bacterium]|nr:FAD-dependent thymidylate synthase [Bacillota bacterium]
MIKVNLLQYTNEPEKLVAAAAKLCYSPVGVDEIMEDLTDEKVDKFLKVLASMHHESPIEHVSFTFAVEGVSRSLTHQLVRHRIASYSQQSQRYVRLNSFQYITPPEIEKNMEARGAFIKAMEESQRAYDKIAGILKDGYIKDGIDVKTAEKKAIEDARYVFPNACETKIVLTMNARSLMNFFRERCCQRAQWEIRALADEMLKQVKKAAPNLFKYAGPSCVNGPCNEGKMSCGKAQENRNKYLEG